MGEVRMAPRDATCYPFPDHYSPKVYHVIVSPPYVAACNSLVSLDDGSETSVAGVVPGMRCHRPACRDRWLVAPDA